MFPSTPPPPTGSELVSLTESWTGFTHLCAFMYGSCGPLLSPSVRGPSILLETSAHLLVQKETLVRMFPSQFGPSEALTVSSGRAPSGPCVPHRCQPSDLWLVLWRSCSVTWDPCSGSGFRSEKNHLSTCGCSCGCVLGWSRGRSHDALLWKDNWKCPSRHEGHHSGLLSLYWIDELIWTFQSSWNHQ